jgi:hypothetical protein
MKLIIRLDKKERKGKEKKLEGPIICFYKTSTLLSVVSLL